MDPINFAGAVARKRGTVVVVGAVPAGYDREPHFYKKELTVRMSCSYGPGRYDPEYEEKGRDYPVGYVRWTEKRNMEAFQALLASGKAAINTYLISKAARDAGVTVLLNGMGGDEIFGGYRKHLACLLAEQYNKFVPAAVRHRDRLDR